MIGKSQKPRALKDTDIKSLPVFYLGQAKGWMTCDICKEWFYSMFVPCVVSYSHNKRQSPKALLLIDKAPSDPEESELVIRRYEGNFSLSECYTINHQWI